MTRRARMTLAAVAGGLALVAINALASWAWGRSGSYAVTAHSAELATTPGEQAIYRLKLAAPAEGVPMSGLVVSEAVYNAVHVGDTIEFAVRRIPGIAVENVRYRVIREGNPVAGWREGTFFFWLVGGAAAVLVALVAAAVGDAVAAALGIRRPPVV